MADHSEPEKALRALCERAGWKLDVWPANRIDPQGTVRVRIGSAYLTYVGRDAESMCAEVLTAISVIEEAYSRG